MYPPPGLRVSLIAMWGVLALQAQGTSRIDFKIDTKLVLVPVAVTNSKGATVTGLPRSGFKIFEDRVTQHISSFSEQDVPASVGVVLDLSGSMRSVLADAKTALRSLVEGADPADEGFLYTVSDRPLRAGSLTGDVESLAAQVAAGEARGSTALVDTVFAAFREFRATHLARRGLVIISDGIDNHSRHTAHELFMEALEANVQVYSICIYSSSARFAKAIPQEQVHQGIRFLQELAERTGGISVVVHDSNGIAKATEAIGRALRTEYLIGYLPQPPVSEGAPRGTRWHAIKVTLNTPGLKVHARAGYYSE